MAAISSLAEAEEATSSPFTILHKYQSQVKRFRHGNIISPVSGTTATSSRGQQDLSAESIVRLARGRLLHQISDHQDFDDSDLSCANLKDVDLICTLLDAAEKLSNKQFECAEKLLENCILISSSDDNNHPVSRAVKSFAEALRERGDRERGKIDLERKPFDLEESLLVYQPVILACEQKLPSTQLIQFTAIQAILDSIGSAKTIHVIDFSIKTGLHWSIMMQGLASQSHGPRRLLKITAQGTSKDRLEETGKRLSSFAESMKLPFLFRSVVAEIKDVDEQLFEAGADEAVVVYSGLNLWSKLATPNSLTTFLKFVKKLNPCVMVVNEIEANTNTSIFMDRLQGALPFTIAMFDCLETCLRGNAMYRKIVEEVFFRDMIRSIIAAEEEEMTHRHVKVSVWREMFAEFNIVETEMSRSSLDQAILLINRSDDWNPCTLQMDGKCIIVGWRGTPLQSISAWKIHHEEIENKKIL